jgi:hypothetical protein
VIPRPGPDRTVGPGFDAFNAGDPTRSEQIVTVGGGLMA